MGLITHEDEVICSIPPAKLFKAFILHGDHLVPKVLPEAFKSIQIIEGDGGVGSIKLITFGEGSHYKCAKHRVDEIDEANHVYKYSIIEGDVLGEDLESISYVVKFEASADGGSVCKTVSHYHTKHDAHGIIEEKIRKEKRKRRRYSRLLKLTSMHTLMGGFSICSSMRSSIWFFVGCIAIDFLTISSHRQSFGVFFGEPPSRVS